MAQRRHRERGRALPFLIEDLTPRRMRVPGGPATDHPNGATGVARLEVSTPDAPETFRQLAALTGATTEPLRLGGCELVVVERDAAQDAGPTAVTLSAGPTGGVVELDRELSHGARLALAPRVDG